MSWLHDPQSLTQTPPKEIRLPHWHEHRERLGDYRSSTGNERPHVFSCLGDAVIQLPRRRR
jgi:hypothetical protein